MGNRKEYKTRSGRTIEGKHAVKRFKESHYPVWEVSYDKKTGNRKGTVLVRAKNRRTAIDVAKYSVFTGRNFRNPKRTNKKYTTPPNQGFAGHNASNY